MIPVISWHFVLWTVTAIPYAVKSQLSSRMQQYFWSHLAAKIIIRPLYPISGSTLYLGVLAMPCDPQGAGESSCPGWMENPAYITREILWKFHFEFFSGLVKVKAFLCLDGNFYAVWWVCILEIWQHWSAQLMYSFNVRHEYVEIACEKCCSSGCRTRVLKKFL